MRSFRDVDARLYRIALHLCPPGFRREFSEEMTRDFEEARRDAAASGAPRALLAFRAQMALDLARTVVGQWGRSGWPAIVAAAVIGPLAATSALASLWPPVVIEGPANNPDVDMITLELLVAVVFLVIAATIVFTLVFAQSKRPRRRR